MDSPPFLPSTTTALPSPSFLSISSANFSTSTSSSSLDPCAGPPPPPPFSSLASCCSPSSSLSNSSSSFCGSLPSSLSSSSTPSSSLLSPRLSYVLHTYVCSPLRLPPPRIRAVEEAMVVGDVVSLMTLKRLVGCFRDLDALLPLLSPVAKYVLYNGLIQEEKKGRKRRKQKRIQENGTTSGRVVLLGEGGKAAGMKRRKRNWTRRQPSAEEDEQEDEDRDEDQRTVSNEVKEEEDTRNITNDTKTEKEEDRMEEEKKTGESHKLEPEGETEMKTIMNTLYNTTTSMASCNQTGSLSTTTIMNTNNMTTSCISRRSSSGVESMLSVPRFGYGSSPSTTICSLPSDSPPISPLLFSPPPPFPLPPCSSASSPPCSPPSIHSPCPGGVGIWRTGEEDDGRRTALREGGIDHRKDGNSMAISPLLLVELHEKDQHYNIGSGNPRDDNTSCTTPHCPEMHNPCYSRRNTLTTIITTTPSTISPTTTSPTTPTSPIATGSHTTLTGSAGSSTISSSSSNRSSGNSVVGCGESMEAYTNVDQFFSNAKIHSKYSTTTTSSTTSNMNSTCTDDNIRCTINLDDPAQNSLSNTINLTRQPPISRLLPPPSSLLPDPPSFSYCHNCRFGYVSCTQQLNSYGSNNATSNTHKIIPNTSGSKIRTKIRTKYISSRLMLPSCLSCLRPPLSSSSCLSSPQLSRNVADGAPPQPVPCTASTPQCVPSPPALLSDGDFCDVGRSSPLPSISFSPTLPALSEYVRKKLSSPAEEEEEDDDDDDVEEEEIGGESGGGCEFSGGHKRTNENTSLDYVYDDLNNNIEWNTTFIDKLTFSSNSTTSIEYTTKYITNRNQNSAIDNSSGGSFSSPPSSNISPCYSCSSSTSSSSDYLANFASRPLQIFNTCSSASSSSSVLSCSFTSFSSPSSGSFSFISPSSCGSSCVVSSLPASSLSSSSSRALSKKATSRRFGREPQQSPLPQARRRALSPRFKEQVKILVDEIQREAPIQQMKGVSICWDYSDLQWRAKLRFRGDPDIQQFTRPPTAYDKQSMHQARDLLLARVQQYIYDTQPEEDLRPARPRGGGKRGGGEARGRVSALVLSPAERKRKRGGSPSPLRADGGGERSNGSGVDKRLYRASTPIQRSPNDITNTNIADIKGRAGGSEVVFSEDDIVNLIKQKKEDGEEHFDPKCTNTSSVDYSLNSNIQVYNKDSQTMTTPPLQDSTFVDTSHIANAFRSRGFSSPFSSPCSPAPPSNISNDDVPLKEMEKDILQKLVAPGAAPPTRTPKPRGPRPKEAAPTPVVQLGVKERAVSVYTTAQRRAMSRTVKDQVQEIATTLKNELMSRYGSAPPCNWHCRWEYRDMQWRGCLKTARATLHFTRAPQDMDREGIRTALEYTINRIQAKQRELHLDPDPPVAGEAGEESQWVEETEEREEVGDFITKTNASTSISPTIPNGSNSSTTSLLTGSITTSTTTTPTGGNSGGNCNVSNKSARKGGERNSGGYIKGELNESSKTLISVKNENSSTTTTPDGITKTFVGRSSSTNNNSSSDSIVFASHSITSAPAAASASDATTTATTTTSSSPTISTSIGICPSIMNEPNRTDNDNSTGVQSVLRSVGTARDTTTVSSGCNTKLLSTGSSIIDTANRTTFSSHNTCSTITNKPFNPNHRHSTCSSRGSATVGSGLWKNGSSLEAVTVAGLLLSKMNSQKNSLKRK